MSRNLERYELMSAKQLSQVVVLSSLAIVLRLLFGPFPNIKPITALFVVSVLYLGLWPSLMIMVITMVGTSLLMGFSSVVLWQVLSFGVLLFIWRYLVLPWSQKLPLSHVIESILTGFLALAYGFVISIPTAWQFGASFLPYWVNGLGFDALHALSTMLFYPIIHSIFRRFYHEKNQFTC